jgi:hypothetical protein
LFELRKDVTQLRDLLAAEQSAEMTDEDEQHGPLAPGRTQNDGASGCVGDFDRRQAPGYILHLFPSFAPAVRRRCFCFNDGYAAAPL